MKRSEQYEVMPKIIDVAIQRGWKDGAQIKKLYSLYPANFGRSYLTDNFYRVIILNHDFVKSFFDEKSWKFHLSQMVLEEDPLEYLVPFMEDLTPEE